MKLLSIKQVCERTGLKYGTIWDWVRAGKIQAVKVGGHAVRIPDTEIDKLIERYDVKDGKIVEEPDMTKLPNTPENPVDII